MKSKKNFMYLNIKKKFLIMFRYPIDVIFLMNAFDTNSLINYTHIYNEGRNRFIK